MSVDNPLWGAPRIHGELLKLGFEVGQTTVGKYTAKRRRPPSQSWKTFPRNHAEGIAALDLFVVPTVDLRMLFVLVIVSIDRRLIVTINVTSRPTAEWIARQVTEAFPWEWAPKFLIRDCDSAFERSSGGCLGRGPRAAEWDCLSREEPRRAGRLINGKNGEAQICATAFGFEQIQRHALQNQS
jgi:hypothetical protein